jgi:hypothetical protein
LQLPRIKNGAACDRTWCDLKVTGIRRKIEEDAPSKQMRRVQFLEDKIAMQTEGLFVRGAVLSLVFSAIIFQASAAQSASFPMRTIRILVPNPAGGSNDAAARILAQALGEVWQQPVVIENKPGGGGNIGVHAAAAAPADGYTILVSSPGPIAINPSLYKKLPFDPAKDLIPVAPCWRPFRSF